MLSALPLIAAAVLTAAGALGLWKRPRSALGISAAALCGAAAAGLSALPTHAPPDQFWSRAAILVLVAGVGSGLFLTATTLSRNLQAVSPVAISGTVLLVQILLLGEMERTPSGAPGSTTATVTLHVLTLCWAVAPALLVAHIARGRFPFIESALVRAVLRIAAWILPVLVGSATVLVLVVLAPGLAVSGHSLSAEIARTVLLASATVLGLCLTVTRLRRRLLPVVQWARAAVLCQQLSRFEQDLVTVVPMWARPDVVAQPTVLRNPSAALYARLVVIWDTTRALLSSTDPRIVDAGFDFADAVEPRSPHGRRTAIAEASWLSQALGARPGTAPEEQFTVLPEPAEVPAVDMVAEAQFLREVAQILRHEEELTARFGDYLADRLPNPDAQRA